MSLENAILEHAGALKELAAAIRSMGGVHRGDLLVHGNIAATGDVVTGAQLVQDKAAELAGATEQRAAATREALKKDEAGNAESNAAASDASSRIDGVVSSSAAAADKTADVVAAVSAEIEKKGTVVPDAGEQDQAPLDYAKDVRPMLLAAIKKGKREAIEAHLAEAGVAKADQLKPEQLPAILKLATELAA